MNNEEIKELCLELMKADTEKEVVELLQNAQFWDREEAWRWFGDEEYSFAAVGNQQSHSEQAIVEKLINSIDAKLICEARLAGYLPSSGSENQRPDTPKSISEARERFFENQISSGEDLSMNITVAATAKGIPRHGYERPSFTITDNGEGQTPHKMPDTMLSLHKGNKDKIKFTQGKFNMGGTGVLEFCGLERNVQLVISKRHPKLIANPPENDADNCWSFTIIRRDDPTADGKSSRYTYLAPIECNKENKKGGLLHFTADSLPIFPKDNKPYERHSEWGTLIKLYEYESRTFKTNMMLANGLRYRTQLMLPEPALPIRFHECRPFGGKSGGSFDTPMPGIITTLKNDYENPTRDNVEWYDKVKFVTNGEKFSAEIFLFKDKKAADSYKRSEGVIFTYNGQCHALRRTDFFRTKKVKHDYLYHSLLVFVDCSMVERRAHEKLFMNSRDRLRDTEFSKNLLSEIETRLSEHPELKQLAAERRQKQLSENTENSESVAKIIENILSKVPNIDALFPLGGKIKNPFKPKTVGEGPVGDFTGKRFPSKFYFRNAKQPEDKYERDAHLDSRVNISFITDAENDYFKRDDEPGEFTLYIVDGETKSHAKDYHQPTLSNGNANMSLLLPSNAKENDELTFIAEINDPSRVEPFECVLVLNVKPPQSKPHGGPSTKPNQDTDEGENKGPKGNGSKNTTDTLLDIPNPQLVSEKDWENHEPPFDRNTAMRIMEQPDAKGQYDFFLNVDNVYLKTYMKSNPKEASSMKLRFSVGMTLVALSIIHQNKNKKKSTEDSEDMQTDTTDINDLVEQMTKAIAPLLLPIIEGVSQLKADDETYLPEDAGEVT